MATDPGARAVSAGGPLLHQLVEEPDVRLHPERVHRFQKTL